MGVTANGYGFPLQGDEGVLKLAVMLCNSVNTRKTLNCTLLKGELHGKVYFNKAVIKNP